MKLKTNLIIIGSLITTFYFLKPIFRHISTGYYVPPKWIQEDRSSCSPSTNIGYLKTHKTGSSSIQNMLFRYGLHHNLIMAVPDISNYFGRGIFFRRSFVLPQFHSNKQINIFAIHTRWDHEEVRSLLPEDSIFITTVRRPEDLFESLFTFVEMGKKDNLTIDEFIKKSTLKEERAIKTLGYNQMSFDSGLDQIQMSNVTAIRQHIMKMERQFDLVLVAERMEESLILLKKLLCWEFEDVVTLAINARLNKFRSTISAASSKLLQQRQQADELLYEHFARKFDQLVEAFGKERMKQERLKLRAAKQRFIQRCNITEDESLHHSPLTKPWSPMVRGFHGNLGSFTCRTLLWAENPMIDFVRRKQRNRSSNHKRNRMQNELPLGGIPLEI